MCVHVRVCDEKDSPGLVYLPSVLSSKDTGESSIVDPEFSHYLFNSGRPHQRQGFRGDKIHALTNYNHKKCKDTYTRMHYSLANTLRKEYNHIDTKDISMFVV